MNIHELFRWVGWNAFLAIIPVVLAYMIAGYLRQGNKQPRWLAFLVVALLGLCWLAFLPNTCYLLSEWRHFFEPRQFMALYARWKSLGDKEAVALLFLSTLFYFCYSTFGALTFALAIRPLARLAKSKSNFTILLGIPLFLLVSLGAYLGLIRRLNSWDLVTHPGKVWLDIHGALVQRWDLFFILAFAGFFWLVYLVTDIWVDGFVARWKQVVK